MADKSFYKETLFLPKTDFPMRANLSAREPNFLKFWEDIDVYQKLKEKRRNAQSFILHDGPPYANASIHIGTATNKILKDFVVKYKFTRRQIICGEKVITNSIGQFSYNDAIKAEMFEKDTYKKYPKVMIKARAWTYGARDIASDICMGLLETTELKQIYDSELDKHDIEYAEVE